MLSGRTKDILKISLADRVAGTEVATAIEGNTAAIQGMAWTIVAQEIATATSASAATTAALKVGDVTEVTNHSTGATTFASVTVAATWPAGLAVTVGDLLRATRKAPPAPAAPNQGLI